MNHKKFILEKKSVSCFKQHAEIYLPTKRTKKKKTNMVIWELIDDKNKLKSIVNKWISERLNILK